MSCLQSSHHAWLLGHACCEHHKVKQSALMPSTWERQEKSKCKNPFALETGSERAECQLHLFPLDQNIIWWCLIQYRHVGLPHDICRIHLILRTLAMPKVQLFKKCTKTHCITQDLIILFEVMRFNHFFSLSHLSAPLEHSYSRHS